MRTININKFTREREREKWKVKERVSSGKCNAHFTHMRKAEIAHTKRNLLHGKMKAGKPGDKEICLKV